MSTFEKVLHRKIVADMLEIRLDTLFLSGTLVLEKIKKINLPVILTIRHSNEKKPQCRYCSSDTNIFTESKRLSLFLRYIPSVEYIDIEFNACIRNEIVDIAKKYQKKIIISYHNFDTCPSDVKINKMIKQCEKIDGTIFKIATKLMCLSSALKFMQYCSSYRIQEQLIFIPMQKTGILFRIFGFLYGVNFTYGTLSTQDSFIGQLSIQDIAHYHNIFQKVDIPNKSARLLDEINQFCQKEKRWDQLLVLPKIIPIDLIN